MRIAVLGSGVVGSSVALLARALGHEVALVGAQRMSDAAARSDPRFTSAYPAASILPHCVPLSGLGPVLAASRSIFAALREVGEAGVRLQRHLTIHEDEGDLPPRSDWPPGASAFQGNPPRGIPRRKGTSTIVGFEHACGFCDMPIYGPWLDCAVTAAGVRFERRRLVPADLSSLDADVLINCLGLGGASLFPRLGPGVLYRGVLVLAAFDRPTAEVLSYGYTPREGVYSASRGERSDVYFYPRTGHCVLGGTRSPGRIEPGSGQFVPDAELTTDTVDIEGIAVPRPILDLNLDLVEQLTGMVPRPPFRALVGYRHVAGSPREPAVALGLSDPSGAVPVIDCCGFGGAGVTLSWGAAATVVDTLAEMEGRGALDVADCIRALRLLPGMPGA